MIPNGKEIDWNGHHLVFESEPDQCRGCFFADKDSCPDCDEGAWVEKNPSPWHTGTPTEDGWYLVAYECVYDCKNKGKIEYFTLNIITDEDGYKDYRGRASDDVWKAVAWQKIEQYKEKEK